MRQDEAYLRSGQSARTLVRTDDTRIVMVVIRAGKRMSEHHANVTASVHAINGRVRMRLPDRTVNFPRVGLIVLGSGLPHDVEADTDGTIVLTLGWNASDWPGVGAVRLTVYRRNERSARRRIRSDRRKCSSERSSTGEISTKISGERVEAGVNIA